MWVNNLERFDTWMSSVLKMLLIWNSSFYGDKRGISMTHFDSYFHTL